MYDIAETVTRWLAAGRPVRLARVIDTRGISSRDPAAAVAHSPGEPLAGQLFSGAGADRLPALLAGASGVITYPVSEPDAAAVGLACGGTARLLVQPADSIPADAWQRLRDQRPICLVTDLDTLATKAYQPADLPRSAGGDLAEIARVFRAGLSRSALLTPPSETAPTERLVTGYWPVPRVLVIGGGQLAEALAANAALLGWQALAGEQLPPELTAADNVVVLSHDLDVSGRALVAALDSDAGYVGALGSRHTQAARADWLRAHGVPAEQLAAIHGPAGLDIGSRTPAEIALAILAEIVAVRR